MGAGPAGKVHVHFTQCPLGVKGSLPRWLVLMSGKFVLGNTMGGQG